MDAAASSCLTGTLAFAFMVVNSFGAAVNPDSVTVALSAVEATFAPVEPLAVGFS